MNRSSYYYPRKPDVSKDDIVVMGEIDRIYTKCPFYGVPRITKQLSRNGLIVNHKKVYRLMKIMGIEAIFPKRNLSLSNPNHEIYPYLLNRVNIVAPDQVWGADITYIRLKKEWLYLVAIIDWFSRYVISWRLSDSLCVDFCLEALKDALNVGLPKFHNSDQGSQFTSRDYLALLKSHSEINISMDGRGRAFDNIFNERFWRTLKYEEVYLKDYQTPKETRSSLSDYIHFYNNERLHQSLNYQTPKEVYFKKKGGENVS